MKDQDGGVSASNEGLGPLVEAAGMVNLLNMGSGSCVHTEGCNGVAQDHLERFAALVRAAERERCAKLCEGADAPMGDGPGAYFARLIRWVGPNAAPEWQARNLQRQPEFGGGLTTRGVC